MLKIAICDDDQAICNQLLELIRDYTNKTENKIRLDVYNSAIDLTGQIENDVRYDLIFLDIEMDGLTGIEFGRWVRDVHQDEVTKIVFISYEKSYAMDLFRIRPMDFLTKPIEPEDVARNIELCKRLTDKEKQYFLYQVDSNSQKMPIHEIRYFESTNRIVQMHTVDGDYKFYEKLEEVRKRVEAFDFWRIHKSYLINFSHVRKFEYTCVTMDDGTVLPISQSYRAEIRKKQKDMLGRGNDAGV